MHQSPPRTAMGRLLPVVAGIVLVMGTSQLLFLTRWAGRFETPELIVIGFVSAIGSFITGVVLMTLGVMVRHQQSQLAELARISEALRDQAALLETHIKQNSDMLDIQRRQIAFLERIAPEAPVLVEGAVPSLEAGLEQDLRGGSGR